MAEKSTKSLSQIVEQMHGLPLSSRTPEEVDEDYDIEFAFARSLGRSLVRRTPKRFESQIVVDILDDLSEAYAEQAKSNPITSMPPVVSIFDSPQSKPL